MIYREMQRFQPIVALSEHLAGERGDADPGTDRDRAHFVAHFVLSAELSSGPSVS